MIAEGLANKEIAYRLGISEHTVKFHVSALLGKLGAGSRAEAVTRAVHERWSVEQAAATLDARVDDFLAKRRWMLARAARGGGA